MDIGDVDVLSVIPGTGATNLGKAIDSAVGGTDTGIAILAVHTGEASKLSVAEEDYDHLHVGELGGLFVEPEQHNHLDEFDVTTGWTVLGNDTTNLATTKKHLTGTDALTFDKADGAANTVFAGIQKTITTLDMGELDLHDIIQTVCYISSLANVDYVFVRVGTDSTNYNEWRVQDTELTADEFITLGLSVGSAKHAGITGNGVDWNAIAYIAVGVAFDNQANTLTGIIFDQLGLFTGSHQTTSISAEVSSEVSSPNVNVKKWGSQSVTLNAGNADSGTLRVVLATDQAVLSIDDNSGSLTVDNNGTFVVQEDGAALTALQLIDDVVVTLGTDTYTEATTKGNVIGAVRNDTLAALAGTDNEIAPFQVNASGALYVEVATQATGAVTNAGTFAVQVDGDALTALQLIDNVVRAEDVASSGGHEGNVVMLIRDDALAANAGVNADGDYTFFRANNDGALWAQLSAGNLGGCKLFNDIDLDEADIDVATGACTVYAIYVTNTTTGILHLKLFNTNSVTMGTTNADASLAIPANADSDGAGFVLPIPACGVAFSTALTVAVTTAAALDDNGAPAAGAAIITIFYQD